MSIKNQIQAGYLAGFFYIVGAAYYGYDVLALDAIDWTFTITFAVIGSFFLAVSLLVRSDEQIIDVTVEEQKTLSYVQPEYTPSAGLKREIETILETGQSSLLQLHEHAEAKKRKELLTT